MKCSNCGTEISWHSINKNLVLASDCSFISSDQDCQECGEELEILFVLNEDIGRNWYF